MKTKLLLTILIASGVSAEEMDYRSAVAAAQSRNKSCIKDVQGEGIYRDARENHPEENFSWERCVNGKWVRSGEIELDVAAARRAKATWQIVSCECPTS